MIHHQGNLSREEEGVSVQDVQAFWPVAYKYELSYHIYQVSKRVLFHHHLRINYQLTL